MRVYATLIIITTMLFSGCASLNTKKLQPEYAKNMDSIAVVEIQDHEYYQLLDYGNPISLFLGGIGSMIAVAESNSHKEDFTKDVRAKGFNYGKEMTKTLVKELKKAGFKVRLVKADKKQPWTFVEDYNGVKAGKADTILDINSMAVAYASETAFNHALRPYLDLKVNIVDSKGRKPVYEKKYMYGYHNLFLSAHDIDAPEKYHFDNVTFVVDHPTEARDGFRDGIKTLAKAIVNDLKYKQN